MIINVHDLLDGVAILISLTAIALVLRKLPSEERLKALEAAVDDVKGVISFIMKDVPKPPA